MTQLKWGIVSTGNMARQFAEDFQHSDGGLLHGVYSRDSASAEAFAADFSMPHGVDSLAALLDTGVAVVYIASPHVAHFEAALACIEAGRHVLCEKPMTVSAAQTRQLFEAATQRGVFLMEALWTRFNPAIMRMLELVEAGAIGTLKSLKVQFGFNARVADNHRLLNPKLGGGALLDVGVYPLFLGQVLLGKPQQIDARVDLGTTGVDLHETLLLSYPGDVTATLSSALDRYLPNRAVVSGSLGYIELPRNWFEARSLVLWTEEKGLQEEQFRFPGKGWHFEASHVNRCIREGRLVSDLFGPEQSLGLAETTESLLDGWGIRYGGPG